MTSTVPRYGHLRSNGFDWLKVLTLEGSTSMIRSARCANCLSINNAKVHIGDTRKFADDVTQRGELVHTDLAGPYPADVLTYMGIDM